MSLVLKFEDTAALCRQVRGGVQRAESLIGDLKKRRWQWDKESLVYKTYNKYKGWQIIVIHLLILYLVNLLIP